MRSQYYPEQSNPLKDQYIFVYKVKITNQSPQTVQLVSRTWEIKAIEATEVCAGVGSVQFGLVWFGSAGIGSGPLGSDRIGSPKSHRDITIFAT